MGYGFGQIHGGWVDGDSAGGPLVPPGKRTLTGALPARPAWAAPDRPAAAPVQADGGGAMDDPFAVHTIAAQGVAGSGGALPHQAAIQASFGHHDVSGVRAHVGGAAAEASAAIGARAYATGDAVAFAATPDLRQAAHEAAHVVQQRGGVRLDGGVGRAGDPYEQHADAVADAVVRGESAQALLDPMAHRGAAGGPAVQRLVAERDGVAIGRLQRLLADATPAEVTNIRRELERVVGHALPEIQIAVDLDFMHRAEEYRLHLPVADARTLLRECDSAAHHAAARPAHRGTPAHAARTITSFGAAALGGIIRGLAGTEGEETEVACTVRVPIPETPLCITGGIAMTVGHQADGFHVEFAPQLGLGVMEGAGHFDLVTTHSSQVVGHTPELAAELLGVALEHEIRAMGEGVPPPFVLAALAGATAAAPFAVPALVLADVGARVYNWARTGRATDPFFVWLANAVFGEGHMASVGRRMTDGDSVETADGGAVDAAGAEGHGHARDEAGVRFGAASHWAMTRDGGAVHEAEFTTIDVELEATLHGFHGKFEAHIPVSHGAHVPGGELKIELGASVETHSVERVIAADLIARASQMLIGALSHHDHTEEARRAAQGGVDAAGALASTARSLIAARAVSAGAASELGVVLELTFVIGRGGHNSMAVKLTDGFEEAAAGQEVEYTHARTIGEVQFDGGGHHDLAPGALHAHAARGVSGGGGALPHQAAIQESFGHHDVSGVRAHVGGAAAAAATAIGASAYATGADVAFAGAPDLRQAAHEAAHVVQQRGGVRLDGGVGRAGDVYEQHADAVAERVVRGESAQALLDPMAHRGAVGGPAVQRELTAAQRTAARAHVVSDLSMEQIAHRIAYLDGDLPASTPAAERHRDGEAETRAAGAHWTAPRHATVDELDRTALHDLGFDTDHLQFFTGQAGLQFWLLPARPDADVTPIIAFRGTATAMDLAEDTNTEGIGMGQFTMNQAVIESAVRRLAAGRGACATGHSLGGALAQIAACFYPDAIVRVVTFQAPGIRRDVVDRLRALPPEARPTAMHHRVDGCIVDDAGEDFVAGDVTLHGAAGIDPVTAHTTFPVLAQHATDFPEWMRGSYEHDIGVVTRAGTTDDPSFGRMLGGPGIAEFGRRHPSVIGGLAAGGLGAVGGAAIRGGVETDEAYTRVWMALLPHAEAGDRSYHALGQEFIMDPCRAAGHAEHVAPMTRNLNQMFPEYQVTQRVHDELPESLTDVGRFLDAVRRGLGGTLAEPQEARVRRIFHCFEVARAPAVETPPWDAAPRARPLRDGSHDDELADRLRALEDRMDDHHRDDR